VSAREEQEIIRLPRCRLPLQDGLDSVQECGAEQSRLELAFQLRCVATIAGFQRTLPEDCRYSREATMSVSSLRPPPTRPLGRTPRS
jgi:hypothetical protein